MKFITLFSTLLAVVAAAPLAEEAVAQDVQAEKPNVDMSAQGVKILQRFSETQPKDGATRTTITYATATMTSARMFSKVVMGKGPCPAGGCFVTAMEATIRYMDKKEANIDTQAWLHHIALTNGLTPLWACGNERPTLRLNEGGNKYGIDFPSSFGMMIDLMAETTTPKIVTLEIAYDYIPKSKPNGYRAAVMYWLQIGDQPAKDGVYKFTTLPSTISTGGKLLYTIGHMHDAGRDMRLYVNSKLTCTSIMHYNLRKGYSPDGNAAPMPAGMAHSRRDGPGGHAAGSKAPGGKDHISDPGACTDFGTVKMGDRMYAEAWYDANAHPLMEHNGAKEKLMGNMRVYIGPA